MEKSKVILSLIYKFTERFAVKGLGLVISIILARLLAPEAFGQVALMTVFTNLSLTLIESGLSTALVQSRDVDDRDYSTVFYITFALSGLMILVLWFSAPFIAKFYESPGIIAPLRFYSFSLILSAFNSIQVARLQREMRFKEMMYCNMSATIGSGIVGIILAYMGFGLWALVIYFFAQVAVSSIAMIFVLRWVPHSPFSMDSAKRLYGFGIKMLAAGIITTLYNDLRPLIIGKKFSTTSLGYYERGQRFSSTISLNLDAAVQSVMFPVLSRSQDDRAQFSAILSRTKQLGAFIIFPAMLGMAAAADSMVRVLLTEEWLPCVIFVQLLCLAEAQVPITTANLLAVKSLGRSDIYAKQEVLRRALMLIVLAISVFCFDSVEAIAVGFLISAWIDAFVTTLPLIKLLDTSLVKQFAGLWKSMLAALIMAAAVLALNALALPLLLKLLMQIVCGVLVYMLMCLILKVEGMQYVLKLIKKRK